MIPEHRKEFIADLLRGTELETTLAKLETTADDLWDRLMAEAQAMTEEEIIADLERMKAERRAKLH